MSRGIMLLLGALLLLLAAGPAGATDPPHNATSSIYCASCHTTHHALGNPLTKLKGIPAVCQSCHITGGTASNKPTSNSDQALPNPGLPSGVLGSGTSHRWDSGASGHVAKGSPNSSTGTVQSGGAFNGPYPKTYTITIANGGAPGTATFNWTTNKPAGPATNTYLDQLNSQAYDGSNGTTSWTSSPWTETDSGSSSSFTALDQFGTAAYTNSNGSYNWTSEPWAEFSDDGTATGGSIRITGGELLLEGGSSTERRIERPINLSGATSATWTFSWRCGAINMESNDLLYFEVSSNGGSNWTLLKTLTGGSTMCGTGSGSESFDILSYANANTKIRFRYVFSATNEQIFIDNVQVAFTTSGGGGGGATGGRILVVTSGSSPTNTGCPTSGNNCLSIRPYTLNDNIVRPVDLTGATAATLTYTYNRAGSTTGVIQAQVYNGSTWTTLESYGGFGGTTGSGSASFDITSSANANTQIRFYVSTANTATTNIPYLYVDNVQVQYTATPTEGTTGVPTPAVTSPLTSVGLNEGISLTFSSGNYVAGDKWLVYVRTDINQPTTPALRYIGTVDNAGLLPEGKVTCSTCHEQHLQTYTPFDPSAPAYGGAGTGAGRHYQRIDNTTDAMCKDCHSARNVSARDGTGQYTSHPVGIQPTCAYCHDVHNPIPDPGLDMGRNHRVECMTCHKLHYSPATDGTLRRVANTTSLCNYCHRVADTAAGSHSNTSTGALWPGGQYGSLFPQNTDTTQRGYCTNCHDPHGWPDAADTTKKYPTLLVDREENLCYTCHDGGPATDAWTSFGPTDPYRHPLDTASQAAGRKVECTDCHNVHKATGGSHTYSTTATSARNAVTGSLIGVSGVRLNYTTTGTFTYLDQFNSQAYNLSNGTTSWTANPWNETDFGGGFPAESTGYIMVTTGNANCPHGNTDNCLRIQASSSTNHIDRQADLTGATSATLSYAYRRDGTAGTIRVDVSGNGGGSWTTLKTFSTNTTGTDSFDMTSYIASNTQIRFYVSGTGGGYLYVDDVQIQYGATTATFGNFVAPAVSDYTAVTATLEYQICFKCHSGYSWLPGSPPNGLSPNGSATTPVETDLAQEFNPGNRSGHPIATGLDNYPNSIAVGSPAKKGLQTAQLSAPWNTNNGTQTMMCSDCHNTDASSPAAQGPHGSAAQFMLRGPNTAWPNVNLSSFSTSFCANCHPSGQNNVHTEGDHGSRQCNVCHVVIPHGSKMSRLLADNDTMPARYAYNNTLSTQNVQGFTKAARTSYSDSNCRAQCSGHHDNNNPSENW